MRKGWEYKRLGEVGTFLRGKGIQKTDFVEKGLPCIHYGQLHTIFGVSTDKHLSNISQELYEKSIIASKNDVLVALTSEDVEGSCRSTAWLGNYDVAISSDAAVYKHSMNPKFVTYYLRSNSFFVEKSKYARGFKVTHIKTSDIAKIPIPIPPLSTQLAIVSELDKINELIRLKKEQLKDFDNLAQSLFYEMFGDPVENEKGWEVKKLIEVSSLINGRAFKQNELLSEGKYKVLRVGNFFTNSNFYYSNLELEDEKYCYKGDLLFAWSASFGAFIWDEDKTIFHYHIWRVLFDKAILDIHYYQYLLNTMTSFFMNDVHGIGMVHLTKSGMEQYELPLPPLSLQRLFAQRIEQIEREKSEVQKSIQDLETLLASRMQYWFE